MFSPARLADWLAQIVGERNLRTSPAHHQASANLIRDTFAAAGFVVREQEVRGPFGQGRNIIAHREGHEHPERLWILGAHYDTVRGSPGADDNGVAVAGLLEAAGVLAGHRFRDSVELVAWDLEEPQPPIPLITLGSRVMAQRARAGGQLIAGVVVLEMIGYCCSEPGSQNFPTGFGLLFPNLKRWVDERDRRGDFLVVTSNRRSRHLCTAIEAAGDKFGLPLTRVQVAGLARLIPDFYRSDHAPFWNRGYPAVMLTDTADFRNPHYHQPSDTPATIDFGFASQVMNTAVSAFIELAGGSCPGFAGEL